MIRLTDKQYKALQDRETELLGQVGHLSTELVEARCKLDKEKAMLQDRFTKSCEQHARDLNDAHKVRDVFRMERDEAREQRDKAVLAAATLEAKLLAAQQETVKAHAAADKKAEERTRALKAELNHAHSTMDYRRAIDLEREVRTWRARYDELLSRFSHAYDYVAPKTVYVGIDPETRQVGKSAMLGMGYGMDPYTIFGMGIKEVAGLKDRVHLLTIDNDTLRAECKKQYAAVLELTERNGRQADALAKVRAKKS